MQTLSPVYRASASSQLLFREPGIADGASLHRLIQVCPPLDLNSPYAYLLLCAHHARTCVVAESTDGIAGFISSYRLPDAPETLFVWQVAVAPMARGQGLAGQMLRHLLTRPQMADCNWLETTVTPSNQASMNLFAALAAELGLRSEKRVFFSTEDFGDQGHEAEMLIRMGPLRPAAGIPSRNQEKQT